MAKFCRTSGYSCLGTECFIKRAYCSLLATSYPIRKYQVVWEKAGSAVKLRHIFHHGVFSLTVTLIGVESNVVRVLYICIVSCTCKFQRH